MNGINKVVYETISVKDPKEGKYGQWWGSGIKVNGEWHNGILNSQNKVDFMLANKGKEIELFFYEDEQYGNQYRLPTEKDRKEQPKNSESTLIDVEIPELDSREGHSITELLKRIEVLEGYVGALVKNSTGDNPYKFVGETISEPQPDTGTGQKQLDDLPF